MLIDGVYPQSVAAPLLQQHLYFCLVEFDLLQCTADSLSPLGVTLPEELNSAVNKRQVEYLLGRYCAAQALEQAGAQQYLIQRGKDRAPVWPDGFTGSISHSHGIAIACAAATERYRAVGIDLEQIVTADTAAVIKKGVINELEKPLLQSSELDRLVCATLIFSAKESLYKLLYPMVGRFFSFSAANVTTITDQQFTIQLTEDLTAEYQRGDSFSGYYQQQNGSVITLLTLSAQYARGNRIEMPVY